MATSTIDTVLTDFNLDKLNVYITEENNNDKQKLIIDSSYLLNNDANYFGNNQNIFTNKQYFNLDIINNTFNIYQLLSNDTNINFLLIDFMIQFYKQIKTFITDNYIINDDIYTNKFTFTFKTRYYLYIDTEGNNNIAVKPNDYSVSFNLNKDYFDNLKSTDDFYKNLKIVDHNSDIDIEDVKNLFEYIFKTKKGSEKLRNDLYFFKDKKTVKNYYTYFENIKINLNNFILKVLFYKHVEKDNNNIDYGFDNFSKDYILYLKNIKNHYTNIKDAIDINIEKNKYKKKPNETEQINYANKTINKLKELNENLEYRYKKINNVNNNLSYQQTKLNYIKSILVLTIIIFVISSILLLSVNYLRKYTYYENGIYATIFLIILIYVFIFWYVSSLKKFNKDLFYEYFSNEETNDYFTSNINNLIKEINDLSDHINTHDTDFYNDYYDTINPLLNIELKNYKNKEYNSRIYDKVANFNINISNRDIKYNIETINYLINLTILLILIFIIIYKIPSITYIIGTIGILLFLFISIIYFARIIRIVRTKSYNYYWNKPLDVKKNGNDLKNN
tara:strand:+ start:12350 stop:14035 length:1686 start_codon:yes stop_codon:yes gene_type:complete